MIKPSEILLDASTTDPPSILQLYRYLELFSEGNPPRHSLFLLGRPSLDHAIFSEQTEDELLIIDPPANVLERFRFAGNVAALYTNAGQPAELPRVQTQAGGVAHLRVGEHYLDIYGQTHHAIVHLPAIGILYGGSFGSSDVVPHVGDKSDGSEELEILRLLARFTKQQNIQLYISRIGALVRDRVEALENLATDVAYLHGLRRTLPELAHRGQNLDAMAGLIDSLLPRARRSQRSLEIHYQNVQNLLAGYQDSS